jgi:hypothetical protein
MNDDSFVFLDDRPWPFHVRKHGDAWWLYYWSEGKKGFVSMRAITHEEMERFRLEAAPQHIANRYLRFAGKDPHAHQTRK